MPSLNAEAERGSEVTVDSVVQERWYPPEEPWPVHRLAIVQEAMQTARDAGWWCSVTSADGRLVRCASFEQPGHHGCAILLTDGSGVTIELRLRISRCPHPESVPEPGAEA